MTKIVYDIKKKYNELDSWIPTLDYGTYNVEVDCTGVAADQFIGSNSPSEPSPFGEKLKKAKPNVFFNLKPININPGIINTSHSFIKCNNIKSFDCSSFVNTTNTDHMFHGCEFIESISGTSAFTKVTSAVMMFKGCTKLASIDCSGFTSVDNANGIFSECSCIKSILGTSAFTNVTNADHMFYRCECITSIDASAFTKITNADWMFSGCLHLTEITFGSKGITGTGTYQYCPIAIAYIKTSGDSNSVKNTVINATGTNKFPNNAIWKICKIFTFRRII